MPEYAISKQNRSYNGFYQLIHNKFLSKKSAEQLIKKCYLPALRLISYTTKESRKSKSIRLFFHSPVGLEVIKELSGYYGVFYADHSMEALKMTIDSINDKFLEKVSKGKTLFSDIAAEVDKQRGAHFKLMWSRRKPGKGNLEYHPKLPKTLGHGVNQYSLYYGHGHDGSEENKNEHQFTLDNDFGKGSMFIHGILVVDANDWKGRSVNPFLRQCEQLCKEYQKYLLEPFVGLFQIQAKIQDTSTEALDILYERMKSAKNIEAVLPNNGMPDYLRVAFIRKFKAFQAIQEKVNNFKNEPYVPKGDWQDKVHRFSIINGINRSIKKNKAALSKHRCELPPNAPEVIAIMVCAIIVTGVVPGLLALLAISLHSYQKRGFAAFYKTHGQVFAERMERMVATEATSYENRPKLKFGS